MFALLISKHFVPFFFPVFAILFRFSTQLATQQAVPFFVTMGQNLSHRHHFQQQSLPKHLKTTVDFLKNSMTTAAEVQRTFKNY